MKVSTSKRRSLPPANSQRITFRVSVPIAPAWKVHSVAKYKRSQYLKLQQQIQKSPPIDENETMNAAKPLPAEKETTGPTIVVANSATSSFAPVPSNLQQPQTSIDNNSVGGNIGGGSNVSNIDFQKEFETLHHQSQILRVEMNALSTVRSNLLWLLKKSTLYETQKNGSSSSSSLLFSDSSSFL